MPLISGGFIGFIGLVLGLYYLLDRRGQHYLLLAASYAFYFTWSWSFPIVLAAVTAFNYLLAGQLRPGRRGRHGWLWVGVMTNVLTLAFFKYSGFFITEVRALLSSLGIGGSGEGLSILLPVGLSFYVLQAISYLVDVSRWQAQVAGSWVDFALYMAYFPKVIAGPIERFCTFSRQLSQPCVVDNAILSRSVTLLVVGLVRKCVIADPLFSVLPDNVFVTPSAFSSPQLAVYLLAYAVAVYNDFAGYTNLVRGVSGFFGIELSRNFAIPFAARDVTEFWTRWHITLSQWLRDYVYYPVARALARRRLGRSHPANIVVPPLVTMLASGLWHGPGSNVVLWGTLMGLLLVSERAVTLLRPVMSYDERPRWWRRSSRVLTLALLLATAVPFAVELSVVSDYWTRLVTLDQWTRPSYRIWPGLVLSSGIDWLQHRGSSEVVFLSWPGLLRSTLLALALLAVFLATRTYPGTDFVYQGF